MARSTTTRCRDYPCDDREIPERRNKHISLAPLDFEQALGRLLWAGPHPLKDDETELAEDREKARPKWRRERGAE